MPKNIVVLSDGTGNSSGKLQKTNVWRMYEASVHDDRQVVMYDDGVGTSSNKYIAALTGAIGLGLERNVIELYAFLCQHYEPGDKIYAFGFSRGAFTIRVLVALIAEVGLIDLSTATQQDAEVRIGVAYRHFHKTAFKVAWWSPVHLYRRIGSLFRALRLRPGYHDVTAGTRIANIEFVGLWDTVGAYGLPVEELRPVVSNLIWPSEFRDFHLSPKVQHACHALALDEERTSFAPVIWDLHHEASLPARQLNDPRISQVWFAGVHANVGGGYPEDDLSLVSLDWIMANAARFGLLLRASCRQRVTECMSAFARQYDSRAGAGVLYRYCPRVIQIQQTTVGPAYFPVIHHSVLRRMNSSTSSYAPLPLPRNFWVLGPDGSMSRVESDENALAASNVIQPLAPDWCQTLQEPAVVQSDTAALKAVVEKLRGRKRAFDVMELVKDIVWCRRTLYFSELGLAAILVLFPLIAGVLADSESKLGAGLAQVSREVRWFTRPIEELNDAAGVIVESIGALAEPFLPELISPWLESLKNYPVPFLALSMFLLFTLWRSSKLQKRIHRLNDAIWRGTSAGDCIRANRRTRLANILRNSELFRICKELFSCRLLPAALAVGVLYVGVAGFGHVAFEVQNALGDVCDNKIAPQDNMFDVGDVCWYTGERVRKNVRYRITLTNEDWAWFDRQVLTDMGGFDSPNLTYLLASPLKRHWKQPWFVPIARVGRKGGDAYPLIPEMPFRPFDAQQDDSGMGWFEPLSSDRALSAVNHWTSIDRRKTLTATFTAKRDGRLYLYVNDVGLGSKGLTSYFYKNNLGHASFKLEEIDDIPVAVGERGTRYAGNEAKPPR